MKIHGWEGPNAATKPLVPPCLPCHKERTKTQNTKHTLDPNQPWIGTKTWLFFLFISVILQKDFLNCSQPFWEWCSPWREMERTPQQGSTKKGSQGSLADMLYWQAWAPPVCAIFLFLCPELYFFSFYFSISFSSSLFYFDCPSSLVPSFTKTHWACIPFSSLTASIPYNLTLFP